ncbi:hypothetical protein MLD38_022340 [Melastoma candidum]|uniref:Uncharacterized protein n=1 Tax=Melastoma candidum TaxID=119954 RepID=A0ACB9QIZ7_9MYRT|nr:hypothetical protein MLD38_022340 [Melastoma candidum]
MGGAKADDDEDIEMRFDSAASHNHLRDGEAREFLAMARRLIDQGKPSQALQSMVMATRVQGGDEAVFHFLSRAREQYRSRLLANSAVDQLASLFAECAIAEAQPLRVQPSVCSSSDRPIEFDSWGPSILQESGRTHIVLDAFADGSSFVCLQCGGLVSIQRKDEHYAYWCG